MTGFVLLLQVEWPRAGRTLAQDIPLRRIDSCAGHNHIGLPELKRRLVRSMTGELRLLALASANGIKESTHSRRVLPTYFHGFPMDFH